MDYTAIYHPEVAKDISALPRNIKIRIKKAIENRLLTDPVKYGEPLRRSLRGHRKLRVGDYRVIYRITNADIIILKIGHRKEVYNKNF
ncbi:MAG: type II toxin-antitoxin system RelE/ParE family toxin [Candidatus Omnitrophica bacterium]|nr:type II toxin-antitoxin system RelE/ParE family toxin [Candidatus Omnitrophota bacterium]MBU4478923.1 type II toxin-antitoxin system RelE/ParE family toxin [Candidatus Omnitrophota bacterium]MCG2704382.1 type II toxin-antitoxin system RelE/ParE family toxin [Candidatus Omnitrophota bacterium]